MRIQANALENAAVWHHYFGKKRRGAAHAQLHRDQIALADHPAQEKYACWGRRGGKSLVVGEVMVPRRAITTPECRQWVFSKTHEQAKIIFENTAGVVLGSPLEVELDSINWSPPMTMKWRNGSIFRAAGLGSDGANVRGQGADIVYVDEAAFIKEKTMEAVVWPLLTDSPIAEIVAISTPNGLEWFCREHERGLPVYEPGMAPKRIQSFWMPTWRNPFINREFLRRQKLRRTRIAWDVEFGARFIEDQASQFPRSVIDAILDDSLVLPEPPIPDRRYVIGYDPADTQDRSGVVVLDCTDQPWVVVHVADISGTGYVNQEAEIGRLSQLYLGARVRIDASHTSVMHHLAALKVPVEEFRFTNETKRDVMDELLSVMERTELLIPAIAEELISELRFYRREKTKTGTLSLGAPEDGYDDLSTALALAVNEAQRRPARTRSRWIA